MAIDRGKLRYLVELRTGQTFRTLRSLRDSLKSTRKEMDALRADLRRVAKDSGTAAAGLTAAGTATKSLNDQAARRTGLSQQAEDAKKTRTALRGTVGELRRTKRELTNVATEAKKYSQAATTAADAQKKVTDPQGFRKLRREIQRTKSGTDNLAGSFLRMGGIIAGFIVARGVLGGITSLIEQSIQFNRTIERTELGIAAILTAVGEVRGVFGETVGQAQQLSLAQAQAREQTRLLRRDALTTAATFEELLNVFQVALAPGLTAGLDVDEVRQFSLRISQAALALGVAQNQLSEEVRAVLSGTIRPQTTRIATALGITNDDIARVRELGQLSEFLEERFAAFGAAGARALDTVDGLIGRVIDGFGQAAGEAGRSVGLYDTTREVLRDILDLFIDFDEFGFPKPDAQTLQVLQVFFDRINNAINLVRDELTGLSFQQVVEGAASLADGLVTASQVLVGVVQGIVDGFSTVLEIGRGIADALGFEFDDTSVREIARQIVSILVTLTTIRASLGLVLGTASAIAGPFSAVFVTLKAIAPIVSGLIPSFATIRALILRASLEAEVLRLQFLGLPAPIQATAAALGRVVSLLTKMAAAVGAAVLAVQFLVRAFTGIDLTLGETVETVLASFEELWIRLRFGFELAFETVANLGLKIFNEFFNALAKPLSGFLSAFVGGFGAIGEQLGLINADARAQLEDLLSVVDQFSEGRGLNLQFDIADTVAEQEAALAKVQERFADIAQRAQEREDAEKMLATESERSTQKIVTGLKLQEEASESLLETIQRVSATFSTARTDVQQVTEASERLRVALQNVDLRTTFDFDPNISGVAARALQQIQREQIQNARELQTIEQRRITVEQQLARAAQAREASQRTLLTLTDREQQVIGQIDSALVNITLLKKQEAELTTQAAVSRAAEREAISRGAAQEAQAARTRRTDLETQLNLLRQQREQLEQQVNQVGESGMLDQEALQFMQERLEVLSQEAGLQKDLETIVQSITDLRERSLKVQRAAAEQASRSGLLNARAEVGELSTQLDLLNQIDAIERRSDASGAALELASLEAKTRQLQQQQQLERLNLLLQVRGLDQAIRRTNATRETAPALFEQRDALANQVGLLDQINEREQERLAREKERARILAEGSAGEAVSLGAEDFIEQVGTLQQQLSALTTNLLQTISQGFSQGLVDSFVNAFDESGDFITEDFLDNLEQAAGSLLQQIATQLLGTLIDNLISNLLSGLLQGTVTQTTAATTSASITTTAATTAGAARISAATTAAQIEIAAAQTAASIRAAGSVAGGGGAGFASGGYVSPNLPQSAAPAGFARSDTVLARLTPKEFVHPVNAVRTYGADVMEKMRRRLIDPSALRALAGVGSMRRLRTTGKRGPQGYASGGPVREDVRQTARALRAQAGSVVQSDTSPAVGVPIDSETFERMLAAGAPAFARHLRDNAAKYDGILRGGRTGD